MRRHDRPLRVNPDVEFVPDGDGFVPRVSPGAANGGDLG